jgi:hypothetical protein
MKGKRRRNKPRSYFISREDIQSVKSRGVFIKIAIEYITNGKSYCAFVF